MTAALTDEQKTELDADPDVKLEDEATDEPEAETFRTFTSQKVMPIGSPTSDGRMIADDADISFRSFPLPMMWCEQTGYGHSDAYTIGVIESAEIVDGHIVESGYILNTEHADRWAQLGEHGVSNPSVDLANAEYHYTDADGKELEGEEFWDALDNGDPVYQTITKAELIGTTLVATPAFDTRIKLNSERETRGENAMVASVVEKIRLKTYDLKMFSDPKLTGPTCPTMDNKTGRIYGHMVEWGHAIRGGNGAQAPRNHNDYANFHTSQIQTDDGKQLSVGRLTVKGGHAPVTASTSAATARAHYDNVCSSFGLVRVGEDAFGIWFSGVAAPGVDDETFQMGMTSPLSGDWRNCGQGLDMIAAHAVNSPGFPVYSGATGPDGRELAMVASFAPVPGRTRHGGMTPAGVKAAMLEVLDERERSTAQRAAAVELAERRQAVLARAAEAAGPIPSPADLLTAKLAAL